MIFSGIHPRIKSGGRLFRDHALTPAQRFHDRSEGRRASPRGLELRRADPLLLFERRDAVAMRTFRRTGNRRRLIACGETRLRHDAMAGIDRQRKAEHADRNEDAQPRLPRSPARLWQNVARGRLVPRSACRRRIATRRRGLAGTRWRAAPEPTRRASQAGAANHSSTVSHHLRGADDRVVHAAAAADLDELSDG